MEQILGKTNSIVANTFKFQSCDTLLYPGFTDIFSSTNFIYLLGTVLLDLEKFDLPSIAEAVVENMVLTDQLKQKDSNKVLAALLLRHRHQHQQGPMNRRTSSKKKPKKLAVGTENFGYNGQTETGNGVVGLKITEQKLQVC